MMKSFYSLTADVILIVHLAFILFVLGGQFLVVAGYFRKWRWVRNLAFRVCHILAIGIVMALAWADRLCPLTVWESSLRGAAGEQPYPESFVAYWVGRVVYYDAPQWVFIVAYSIFGLLVILTWIWVRPEPGMAEKPSEDDD